MKIANIREAPLLRAYLLINQEKNKKGFKVIQPEISKMSEVFGTDFDRNLHLILFNDIDFKDFKSLQNPKKRKIQYFLQDFPQFIERPDFVEIFSRILMETKNCVSTLEIFNGLNKICKLTIENQIKLILSFFMSDTDRYQEEAKSLLLEKCKEIMKEKKLNSLAESTISTLLTVLDIFDEEEDQKNMIEEYKNYFMNYEEEVTSNQSSSDDIRQISDLEKVLDTGKDGTVEVEKLFMELGPFILKKYINLNNNSMIDTEIDVNRLGEFIIFMVNHQTWEMDEELKELNKIFLESIDKDKYKNIDDTVGEEITWDLDSLYSLFKKNIAQMDTNQVLNSLDNPSFCIKDKKSFDFLIEVLTKLKILEKPEQFFNNLIFTKWNNEINQIEFIDFIINNKEITEGIYGIKNYKGTKITKDLELNIYGGGSNNNVSQKNQYLVENWRITELLEVLLRLSKGEFYNSVKEIFKWPIQNIPEILTLGLVNINPDSDAFIYDELTFEVIPKLLINKNTSFELIDEIWKSNKDLIVSILAKMWETKQDSSNINLIFDISTCKLRDSLNILVNSKYYNFSVNLGIFAAKKEFIDIKEWLKERIFKIGDEFIEALLNYIKKNLIQECSSNNNNLNNNGNNPNNSNTNLSNNKDKVGILEKAHLTMENLALIIDNVISSIYSNKRSQKTKKYIQEIYKSIFDFYDEIQAQLVNSDELEEECTQLFQSMFNEEITVDEIIEKLKKYKKSSISKETEMYACTIHSLLDEYRFYYSYPEKQIKLSAELFGKVINNNLVEGVIETIALKYILEGIKVGKGPMFNFGTIALSQFINQISHWPHYMNSLMEIQEIKLDKELHQKLLKQYNDSKNKERGIIMNIGGGEMDSFEGGGGGMDENDKNILMENVNSRGGYVRDKDEPSNVNKLRDRLSGQARNFVDSESLTMIPTEKEIQIPAEEVINKIKFILGSMNKSNLKDKLKDLKNILVKDKDKDKDDKKIIRWFSYYFVTSKITSENGLSFQLFNDIITQIDNKDLSKIIIKDTIYFIHFILDSENLYKDDKTKNLLKNLGTWLGISTLSKNRPILAKDLDFKELIFSEYENGRLITIIPFICRVFERSAGSNVFHRGNPWIAAIMDLLRELESKNNISIAIKNEIDQLFSNLNIDYGNSPVSTKYLDKYHPKPGSNDFYSKQSFEMEINTQELFTNISTLDHYINNLLGIFNSDPNIYNSNSNNNSNTNNNNNRRNNNNNNNNQNNNNINNNLWTQNDMINMLVTVMSHSVKSIIPDVMDLFVTTPIKSAIAIVNKDFMFEKSEDKYKSALENTMKILVKSLSIMGSRDKLKTTIDNEWDRFLKNRPLEPDTINKIKQQPNSEYICVGLDCIQKYIQKEAPKLLNKEAKVKNEIENRKHGNNFQESKTYIEYKKKTANLPEELKPNENAVGDNVYKVYEKFDSIYKNLYIYEGDSKKSSFLNKVYRLLKEVLDKTSTKSPKKKYELCMKNIQNESKVDNSCEDDQQLNCLEKIISESKITDVNLATELALNTFQYAANSVKNGNNLLLTVYSYILKGWVKLHNEIQGEITKKLLSYDDIFIRFNYQLHYCFLRRRLINVELYEKYFSKLLEENQNCLIAKNFIKKIITPKIIFSHIPPYFYDTSPDNYYFLFNAKSQIISNNIETNNSPIFLKKLGNDYKNFDQFRDTICNFFDQLIYYYWKNNKNFDYDKMRKENKNIFKSEILSEDKMQANVIAISEICIRGPLKDQNIQRCLYYPENVSQYFYLILYGLKKDKVNKLKLFNTVLNGIITLFHNDYLKSENNFNQRAYYKVFYNLIYLLNNNNQNNFNSNNNNNNSNNNNNNNSSNNNNKDSFSSSSNYENILDSEYKKINYFIKLSDALKIISPLNYPGFAMGWIDLISSKNFSSNFLEPPPHSKKKEKIEKYEKYLSLVIEALTYLNSFGEDSITDYNYVVFLEKFYKFFFILVNSYPEFVCNYYYLMIVSLNGGTNFIQLKNLILSACPSNVINNLPDIESVINQINNNTNNEDNKGNNIDDNNSNSNNSFSQLKKSSNILFDITSIIEEHSIKEIIDKYINEPNDDYLAQLVKIIQVNNNSNNNNEEEDNSKEINRILNIIVIYWGLSKHKYYTTDSKIKSKKEYFTFFSYLLQKLNPPNRDLLIHSLLNSLRYPCSQTLSYSILYQELFLEIKNKEIEEHLLNNLLQRLLYKPYPWGLKFTFMSLMKKERFHKMTEFMIMENGLEAVLRKIEEKCKDNDLVNFITE